MSFSHKIFVICNQRTRAVVESPVEKLCGVPARYVGLANHTVLVGKDGNEFQIDDSAAPILNKEGAHDRHRPGVPRHHRTVCL